MKALTVWQPWASLIVVGAKPYEFRGWHAPRFIIGERIVIHAAARKIDRREVEQLARLLDAGGSLAARTCLHTDRAVPLLKGWLRGEVDLPLAAGLGTARVGTPKSGWDVAAEFGVDRANDSDRDAHANWGWPMLEVERWPEPFDIKGAQGFWTWPDAEAMAGEAA